MATIILPLLLLCLHAVALPYGLSNTDQRLHWAPCKIDWGFFEREVHVDMDCAILDVPLDYTNTTSEGTLSLHLARVNATKEPVQGSIILNPGGPGDSGIQDLAFTGALYNTIVGGHFDLISFDPRGTGNTIPFACDIWNESTSGAGVVRRAVLPNENMTELLIGKDWHDSTIIADACFQAQNETVDALNEDGMLRYWGLSYGTVLGMTIAAMFPDRIDRIYLDSVVNPLDYMAGYWLTASRDSGHALTGFFDACIKAGQQHYLIQHPRYLSNATLVYAWNKYTPASLYQDIKQQLYNSLYSPVSWSYIVQTLLPVLAFDYYSYYHQPATVITPGYNKGAQAFWGIACSDASYRARTYEDMEWLVKVQQNVSSFSDLTSHIWPCYQWNMSAAERYTGNFSVKTSSPILFTNGLYDPITPYSSAVKASAGFEGSVLLTHGGHGHTSLSDPSLCTFRAIRSYFVNGTLPNPQTYCPPDSPPFQINFTALDDGDDTFSRREVSYAHVDEDEELSMAVYKLTKYYWRRLYGTVV